MLCRGPRCSKMRKEWLLRNVFFLAGVAPEKKSCWGWHVQTCLVSERNLATREGPGWCVSTLRTELVASKAANLQRVALECGVVRDVMSSGTRLNSIDRASRLCVLGACWHVSCRGESSAKERLQRVSLQGAPMRAEAQAVPRLSLGVKDEQLHAWKRWMQPRKLPWKMRKLSMRQWTRDPLWLCQALATMTTTAEQNSEVEVAKVRFRLGGRARRKATMSKWNTL